MSIPRSAATAFLLGAAMAATRPPEVLAQDPAPAAPTDCGPTSTVGKVLITLASNDTVMTGQPFTVRVLAPVPADLSAVPDTSGAFWVVRLADSVRADTLQLQPRLNGYRSALLNPVSATQRNGECIARASFQVSRIWSVEVSSRPVSLLVEVSTLADTASSARWTRFTSREFDWTERLLLRVHVNQKDSFERVLDPVELSRASEPIRLTSRDMQDLLCEQGHCANVIVRMFRGSVLRNFNVEEVSLRLVWP